MLKFEERLASLSVPEKEKAIAKYIDLNRKALDGLDLKMILVIFMLFYQGAIKRKEYILETS